MLFPKLYCPLVLTRGLEHFMIALCPDRQGTRFGFGARTGRPHYTRLAVFFGKADWDRILTGHILVGLPLPTSFAWRTGRDVGLPVDCEGAIIKAGALPGLPAGIGGHMANDGHPILLFAPHEDFRIRIATVDQMLLREEGVLGQGGVDRLEWIQTQAVREDAQGDTLAGALGGGGVQRALETEAAVLAHPARGPLAHGIGLRWHGTQGGLILRQAAPQSSCLSCEGRRDKAIVKRGDCYLRRLLMRSARAVVRRAAHEKDARDRWVQAIKGRHGPHIACVAVANKCTRIFWVFPAKGMDYRLAA